MLPLLPVLLLPYHTPTTTTRFTPAALPASILREAGGRARSGPSAAPVAYMVCHLGLRGACCVAHVCSLPVSIFPPTRRLALHHLIQPSFLFYLCPPCALHTGVSVSVSVTVGWLQGTRRASIVRARVRGRVRVSVRVRIRVRVSECESLRRANIDGASKR